MASQHGVEALVAVSLWSQAFKNGRGRLSGTKIMNEDIKVINRRWPSRRERREEDSSSLLHTMPLFPATAAAHAVINDAASQNIYFSSSCAILEKLLFSFHVEPCACLCSPERGAVSEVLGRGQETYFFFSSRCEQFGCLLVRC